MDCDIDEAMRRVEARHVSTGVSPEQVRSARENKKTPPTGTLSDTRPLVRVLLGEGMSDPPLSTNVRTAD